MVRFHNVDNDAAVPISLSSSNLPRLSLYEFVDGQNIYLYFAAGEWNVATSRSPTAEDTVRIRGLDKTQSECFWATWKANSAALPSDSMRSVSFTFQLVLKDRAMILPYDFDDITLVGARDRVTGAELDIFNPEFAALGWHLPKRYSFDDVMKFKVAKYATAIGKLAKKKTEPLQLSDVEASCATHWESCPGWVIRESTEDGVFSRSIVLNPLVAKLTQFRYGTRQQQEQLLLAIFALYSAYNHETTRKCPFVAVDQESNCCEAFEYVKTRFDELCVEIDSKVAQISKDHTERKTFAPAAEKLYPDECVRTALVFGLTSSLNLCLALDNLGKIQGREYKGHVCQVC